jgi:ATP-dependent DNA helicase RecG
MDLAELNQLVAQGESDRLEFKKSTGELKAGMQSLCAMLNGSGGMVLFGVTADRRILQRRLRGVD